VEIQQEQLITASRNEPQPNCGFWEGGVPGVLLSCSSNRGWSGLSAELRSHVKGVVRWQGAPPDIQVCVDIRGNGSPVTRRAFGIVERTVTRPGTVWLRPAGRWEGSTDVGDDLPEIMHIRLSPSQFSPDKLGIDIDDPAGALRYERAFEDPLLGAIARAIASELQAETSAGKLLVESLASSIAARLVQTHIGPQASQSVASPATGGLDRRRLSRILDYIEAHLEGDLALDRMASIACLSRYHFARAFRQAVGQSPHRYVSARRLEHAKALLIRGDRSLVDIALALSFSSQANFARAFRQATGLAPGRYRRELGSGRRDSLLADTRRALPILA
jgi:AraC family transcriptional regulator